MTSEKPPTEDTEPQEPLAHCKCATEAEIIAHIESIITSLITAVNATSILTSPPWTSVSPAFTFPGIGFRQKATTRFDYIKGFRKVAAGYSQFFQIEALKMESYVLLAAGYAEVHLTAESFGGPTLSRGMKRSNTVSPAFCT